MVDASKTEETPKLSENNTVIMSSPTIKPEGVIVEHEGEPEGKSIDTSIVRKQKEDPLTAMRSQMEAAERATKEANERAANAERERDVARTQVETTKTTLAKSESEKIITHETAIISRVETATAEVENAERALEEAIDTGKSAKEQIRLQKMLAESVYKLKGAEGAKIHFDNWKEREKNKPVVTETAKTSGYSDPAQRWIDARPQFKTDKNYKRLAEGAAVEVENSGVKPDTPAYFRAIEEALRDAGFNADPHSEGATMTTSTIKKQASGTSTAAPASHDSATAGASGGNAAQEKRSGSKVVKLDENQRNRAIAQYGKNSTFKLPDSEAYQRYAARLLEIKERRANGERI